MFQKVFEKYGDDIAKFISIEKAKVFTDEQFEVLKKKITENITSKKSVFFAGL